MSAYYNEIDEYAAQWLRNLIVAGHIAPGDVDTRSIEDVHPDDLRPYTQCHFFAGIGVWSHALRRAGWADDRPIWTGSCPCQPFSAAGKGGGFDDQRHLWPAWYWLVAQCRPATILGEQVASKDVNPWIDLVQADLEALGYGFGAVPFPAAGIGAPHIRDRLYWVAEQGGASPRQRAADAAAGYFHGMAYDAAGGRLEECSNLGRRAVGDSAQGWTTGLEPSGAHEPVANASCARLEGCDIGALGDERATSERSRADGGMANNNNHGQQGIASLRLQQSAVHDLDGRGSIGGFWSDAEWLACRDGVARPVEPGTFPLAYGIANRVGRLRAYGNAIVAPAAQIFIECVVDALVNNA